MKGEKLTMEGIVEVKVFEHPDFEDEIMGDVNFPNNSGQSLCEYLATKEGKKVRVVVELLD